MIGKLKNLIARCIVDILKDGKYSFTCLNGEYITDVEHLQEFGFASKKPSGTNTNANGIAIFHGGDRGNATLLVLEIPSLKPSLEDGESAVFNAFNSIVKLDKDGRVQLNGTSNLGIVKIVELTAKLNAHIAEYNAHVHGGIGAPYVPTVQAVTFTKDDYENTKVVH